VLAGAVNLATIGVAQQVVTESGTISGVNADGLSVYRGVPFAAPPVGGLRWRARAQPMYGYIRHRNPALNLAVPSILALLPTPDEPPDRHPFKSAASMCI